MNPKTIALTITTLFLVLILYLLGLRISVSYGEIKNIQEEEVEVIKIAPAPSLFIGNNSPTFSVGDNLPTFSVGDNLPTFSVGDNLPTFSPSFNNVVTPEEEGAYLGPYGYISQDNIARKEDFPHHNPFMYQEKEKDLLNNITE